jgi:alanine dehydrogenase
MAGLNVAAGLVTNEAVAHDQGREWTAPGEVFAAAVAA